MSPFASSVVVKHCAPCQPFPRSCDTTPIVEQVAGRVKVVVNGPNMGLVGVLEVAIVQIRRGWDAISYVKTFRTVELMPSSTQKMGRLRHRKKKMSLPQVGNVPRNAPEQYFQVLGAKMHQRRRSR